MQSYLKLYVEIKNALTPDRKFSYTKRTHIKINHRLYVFYLCPE